MVHRDRTGHRNHCFRMDAHPELNYLIAPTCMHCSVRLSAAATVAPIGRAATVARRRMRGLMAGVATTAGMALASDLKEGSPKITTAVAPESAATF